MIRLSLAFAFALALAGSPLAAVPAGAGPPSVPALDDRDCRPVCAGACVKPIVVPDRWDDVTPIAGHEEWAGNGRFDAESHDDLNANGLRDADEPFDDANANGRHDEEAYHPALTGYVPDPVPGNFLAPEGDLGRLIRLRPNADRRPAASHYGSAVFPPLGKGPPGRGARAYRDALEGCVTHLVGPGDLVELEPGAMGQATADGLRALHAQDPGAAWDPVSREVVGSRFDDRHQVRVVLLPLADPRIVPTAGRTTIPVVKIAAFFFEAPTPDGEVSGRFLKVRAVPLPCGCECGHAASFQRHCD